MPGSASGPSGGAAAGQPVSGPAVGDRGLSREQRLTHSRHIQDAFDQGLAIAGRLLVLRLRRGPDAALRLGVVVSKRAFRRAVDRARAKRLMREAFRLNRARLAGACDVVLMARPAMRGARRQDVEADLMAAARKAGLLARPPGEANDVQPAARRRT